MVLSLSPKTTQVERGDESRTMSIQTLIGGLSLLLLAGCDGSSGGNPPADDFYTVPVTTSSNPPGAAGVVEWDALPVDSSVIRVVIDEDSSLQLRVSPDTSSEPLVLTSFPESGAAVLFDGILDYTPDPDYFGLDSIGIERDLRQYTIHVEVRAVNDAPEIIGDVGRVAEQGVLYSSQLEVSDIDDTNLAYSSSNLPAWLSFDANSGRLSGVPAQQDVGLHEGIRLIVRDPGGLDDALSGVSIEVLDVNDAPTLNVSQFPSRLDGRESIVVNVFPDDIDGDSVSLVVEPNDFVSTSVNGGTVSLQANDVMEVTDINLVLIATDQQGQISREVVPLALYPMTTSGRGRTLEGFKAGAGVHMVVLGDGYREDQQARFRDDVEYVIRLMSEDPAISVHLSAWNIHMVETPSVDSGIDDNVEIDVRDTVFDSGYFCLSVPRLICGDNREMFDVALDEYPDTDVLVMLVNDPRYGGSGGSVAVASSSSPEIALHELGHSFAELGDEYVDSSIPAVGFTDFDEGVFANLTRIEDPARVPWSHWVDLNNTIPTLPGDEGVGVFRGGFYDADAFFRPTYDSRMRTYNEPFGPVNGEAWALAVYRNTTPVVTFSPRVTDLTVNSGELAQFSVEPIFGAGVQRIVWTLNGRLLTSNVNDTEVELTLPLGDHSLTLSVNDLTGTIRKPGPHTAQFLWRWDITVQ